LPDQTSSPKTKKLCCPKAKTHNNQHRRQNKIGPVNVQTENCSSPSRKPRYIPNYKRRRRQSLEQRLTVCRILKWHKSAKPKIIDVVFCTVGGAQGRLRNRAVKWLGSLNPKIAVPYHTMLG
jgi:hypothetical protein